ncbi:MAG: thiamine phosphate synthase [Acidobacteria bacterium]|nr:MAG: thiamine phosphate synthase [Acidobacteriota bacterium]PYQ86934.1 MAG: thiamine phosphate synthase [Acidobacteriota bacterium]PYQ89099.1 MAG: thiamine phosphate synthase [Acidobacteriota bacterium]PYR07668.1 MAG: thiamine phosphate synthase [Acidobacteriota bacterium]
MTDGRIPHRIPNPKSQIPVLNAIVDAECAAQAGWTPVDLADAYLRGGARFLQLRAKTMSSAALLDAASAIVSRAHRAGAIVIVNDRADIARLADADGVHVGQDDLPPGDARRVVGDRAMVGVSTHTDAQVARAMEGPVSYVAIGPVFGTSTKATGYGAIGLDLVRVAANRTAARNLPLLAIGGITIETAARVIEAGATSVAVISDLLRTGDPEQRVREYLRALA